MRRCNGPVSPMRHWINLLHTLSSPRDKIAITGGSLCILPPCTIYLFLSLLPVFLTYPSSFPVQLTVIEFGRIAFCPFILTAYCLLHLTPYYGEIELRPSDIRGAVSRWFHVKKHPREHSGLQLVTVCERCCISDAVSLINFSSFRQNRGPSRQIEATGYTGKLDGDVFWYLGEKKKWLRWSKGAGLLSENTDLMHGFS